MDRMTLEQVLNHLLHLHNDAIMRADEAHEALSLAELRGLDVAEQESTLKERTLYARGIFDACQTVHALTAEADILTEWR